ncbi:putative ribonuclease H-like domain-containing protein [Tanacetum coccineum]
MVKPVWNNAQRVNHQNFAKKTHPCAKKNMVSRAVLIKYGLVSINTARQNISKIAVSVNTARQVNTAHSKTIVNVARPMSYLSKTTHSTVKRPINNNTTFKNSNINQRVNTVRGKNIHTARPKAVVKAVQGNNVNDVKASACWGNPQMDLQDKGVVDSRCSRHMTGNMSYLTDYEEIDGGYVAFRGNPKGGKITRKGTIKTGNLDFENVNFVRELKFNLFTVLQMCDKKNSVLFNDTECIVLSPNFKLIDESQVLLRVPKKNNMYNVDLKNIVPKRGLTCLFAKATSDESKFWHRRLGQARKKTEPVKDYILLPLWTADPPFSQDPKSSHDDGSKPSSDDGKKVDEDPRKDSEYKDQEKDGNVNSINNVNVASTNGVNVVGAKTSIELPFDPNMPALEDISIFDLSRGDEDDDAETDMNNLDITIQVSPNPTTRIHKDHPLYQVIRDLQSATQTRRMLKNLEEHGFVSTIQQRTNHKDLQNCLFACFLSQKEPKKNLVDLPNGKRAIGTKWVFRNKKNERRIVIRNKARLVAQGYTQEEEINYDEVFAHIARIEVIRLFLAYASFKDFMVYQMDVKSDFIYGKIEEEVYVCQPPGFEDPDFPDRVYKVEKALYGLHQAPRAWYETLSTYLLDNEFQRGKIDKTLFIKRYKGLQVQQKKDGIFISQDKYVGEILKKFGFIDIKTASTPMETQKPMLKDEDGEEVNVYMYRSMIGSLMYLTSLRPDIMFAVCACARYQVNPKVSHLYAMKRIFRYLKGQPKLGLWYPKDSPFDLVAYTDSGYAGASLDGKSITGGYQFPRSRLISWQCKKQTMVANSITEVEYAVASSCYRQVL